VAAVAATPTSGVHLTTAFEVACTAISSNDLTAYNATLYPSSPQLTYYFKFALAGQDSIKSPVFSTNSGSVAEWHNVILPAAGSWTLTINSTADDSVKATATVVVS
jgi:hypothetical protein